MIYFGYRKNLKFRLINILIIRRVQNSYDEEKMDKK